MISIFHITSTLKFYKFGRQHLNIALLQLDSSFHILLHNNNRCYIVHDQIILSPLFEAVQCRVLFVIMFGVCCMLVKCEQFIQSLSLMFTLQEFLNLAKLIYYKNAEYFSLPYRILHIKYMYTWFN